MIPYAPNGQAALQPELCLRRKENVYKSQGRHCATVDRNRRRELVKELYKELWG
ncbi:hypothetical protein PDIG_38520 [Penicillium digitatum PHI26]|uniref:Uncharacterized protein n=2 Tax=Penicillium digitatum TaxID=36651 RepID=K9FV30_PEND2|nr:hypothetical protein PDIP_85160 [Penicillium digitatum Pd1]EKV05024.1 hypothetical protein PDIP_85160 [Penicillium digitatum Pd1]EKV13470.1 hypothetical protein PDIG_38520 [Penicillium digitatum PHI26]